MRIFLAFFLGLVLVSCVSEPNKKDETIHVKQTVATKANDSLAVVFLNNPNFKEDFKAFLDAQPVQQLPYGICEEAFYGSGCRPTQLGEEELKKLESLDPRMFDELQDTVLRRVIGDSWNGVSFFRKLPVVNEEVGMMIIQSRQALFMVSYDLKSMRFIDAEPLGLWGDNYFDLDSYFSSGFYINPDQTIYNSILSVYESPTYVQKNTITYNNEGKFTSQQQFSYEASFSDAEDDFDYPYYNRSLKTYQSTTDKERAASFQTFLKSVPLVQLPYSSEVLKSYYTVSDPDKQGVNTELKINKLKMPKETPLFFSNNPNAVSFSFEGEDHYPVQKKQFYPVFRFKWGDYDAVGFLFQSYYQTNETVSCKLNIYDSAGNIRETQIIARNYYGFDYQNFESFIIDETAVITLNRWKHEFESGYEGVGKNDDTRESKKYKIDGDGRLVQIKQ